MAQILDDSLSFSPFFLFLLSLAVWADGIRATSMCVLFLLVEPESHIVQGTSIVQKHKGIKFKIFEIYTFSFFNQANLQSG